MTTRGSVPPPPTRYGPKSTLQRQASPAGASSAVPPPTTRFGAPRKLTMRVLPSWGGATVQRAAAAEQVVVAALSGGYKDLYDCLLHYCPHYIDEHDVDRKLKIGQALGLAAPEHTGHHSDAGGNDSNDLRAQTNQGHYESWVATNRVRLGAAVIAQPAPKAKNKALHQSQAQHDATVKAKADKSKQKKASAHDAFHDDPKNIGKKCGVCGKKVTA